MKRQITIGELIDLLSSRPQDHSIAFDFCGLEPDGFTSYRGYYYELAICYKKGSFPTTNTVGSFLGELRATVGKTFEGYKGGDFVMTRETPLWVANYSETGYTAVVGLAKCGFMTIIATRYNDR